jgi:hypothetical protein
MLFRARPFTPTTVQIIAVLACGALISIASAEDIKTRDGSVYKDANYKLARVE